jgi:D-mannonate dehydratase
LKLSNTIQKIISVFLIVVFALSITPVIVLHTLAANHKDISYANKQQTGNQLSKAGINCNCINFVAEAQFLSSYTIFNIPPKKLVAVFKVPQTENFYSVHAHYTLLRGPPFLA